MSIVLLDTNIVSYIMKKDTRAADYAPLLHGHRLAVSFMTVAELFEWAAVRKWGNRRVARLDRTLSSYFVVPVDIELCRIWGRLRAQQRAAGTMIAPQDAWIASTAIRHALPLITHNPSDFQYISNLDVRSTIV